MKSFESAKAGCLPLFVLLNGISTESNILIPLFFATLSGFLASITGPNVRAILQNVTMPQHRGTAFAFLNTTDDVGKGAGPFLIAVFVNIFGDRKAAFNFCTAGWVFGAMLNFCIYCTLTKDQEKCQESVKRNLEESIEMSKTDAKKCERLALIHDPA